MATDDPDAAVRRLATLSLCAVFCDVLPAYRVRLPSAAEAAQKVSKDVRRTQEHERALLAAYQRYAKLPALAARSRRLLPEHLPEDRRPPRLPSPPNALRYVNHLLALLARARCAVAAARGWPAPRGPHAPGAGAGRGARPAALLSRARRLHPAR